MAVENAKVNNVLTQFENDNSYLDKLDELEKTQLKKVEKKDCISAKQELGDTVIYKKKVKDRETGRVTDKPVTLKEVMKSFSYNTKEVDGRTTYESFVTINNVPTRIDSRTDLGALIQMYALSHNEVANVGTTGIDGIIGEKTINGLHQANLIGKNNEKTIDENEGVDTYKGEWITIDQLTTTSFTQAFNSLGNGVADKFKDYGMLNKDTGKLVTLQSRSKEKDECTLSYIGRHGVRKTIKVKLGIDANSDKLNIKTLAQNIKTAVDNKEEIDLNEEKRKGIEKGINDYKETSIDDPIIKKYFVANPHDHSFGGLNDGEITIKSGNESWKVKKTNITDSSGWFKSGKFAGELVKHYKNNAIALEKNNLKASTNRAKGLSDTTVRSTQYRGIINQIDSYPPEYVKKFTKERNEAVRQLNYEIFNNSLKNVEKEIYNKDLSRDKRIENLKMVVYVEKENGHRVVDYDNTVTEHFDKVGKKGDYLTRTKKLADYVFGRGNYVEKNG